MPLGALLSIQSGHFGVARGKRFYENGNARPLCVSSRCVICNGATVGRTDWWRSGQDTRVWLHQWDMYIHGQRRHVLHHHQLTRKKYRNHL